MGNDVWIRIPRYIILRHTRRNKLLARIMHASLRIPVHWT